MPLKKTIMLIEDDDVSHMLMQEYLNELGVNLIHESLGYTGLRTFTKINKSLQLVILDIRLPDADGIAIQRRMHSMRPELPIVAFTALDADIKSRCIKEGFNEVIEKPLNFRRLDEILKIYLQ